MLGIRKGRKLRAPGLLTASLLLAGCSYSVSQPTPLIADGHPAPVYDVGYRDLLSETYSAIKNVGVVEEVTALQEPQLGYSFRVSSSTASIRIRPVVAVDKHGRTVGGYAMELRIQGKVVGFATWGKVEASMDPLWDVYFAVMRALTDYEIQVLEVRFADA